MYLDTKMCPDTRIIVVGGSINFSSIRTVRGKGKDQKLIIDNAPRMYIVLLRI
jgi:hypothetical protein